MFVWLLHFPSVSASDDQLIEDAAAHTASQPHPSVVESPASTVGFGSRAGVNGGSVQQTADLRPELAGSIGAALGWQQQHQAQPIPASWTGNWMIASHAGFQASEQSWASTHPQAFGAGTLNHGLPGEHSLGFSPGHVRFVPSQARTQDDGRPSAAAGAVDYHGWGV